MFTALKFRLTPRARTIVQVALLSAVWMAASLLSRLFLPAVPAGVLGMLLVLAALWTGWLPVQWCRDGARWLLAEMLLFFIPAVVAVVRFPDLVLSEGWKILLVIVASTAIVMTVTSLVVDRCYRIELRLKRRIRRGLTHA
ncbi:CidA/LrgA family protein [Paludibacterium paludis]|uniref:Murein hydrolase exporter n=1 Tax=Paludibacterium paludis TaxID=1225769 RepID=A0A918U6K3_9NEIS|nr:CidA/LrgA family protein [Paludibacterium paludis]GGY03211.1 murein hydrolase exporter [Paludibacterium paludis]